VPELASWVRAGGGGGGAPAFAAALPTASDGCAGWFATCCSIIVLQKSFVQVLERAKGRGDPSGGILDVVARQPYLRAGRAKVLRKATNRSLVVYDEACLEIVLLGRRSPRRATPKPSSLVVRLVQAHVDPSVVLQVPFLVGFTGAFLQQGIGYLVVNMLLL
jgi:hypothetical protein